MKRLTRQFMVLLVLGSFFVGPAAGVKEAPVPVKPAVVPGLAVGPSVVAPVAPKTVAVKPPAVSRNPPPTVVVKPVASQGLAPVSPVPVAPLAAGAAVPTTPHATTPPVAKTAAPVPVKKRRRPAPPKRCEPQSLTYARQRSGIMSCRNGRENGPMTWFASEKKAGRTSTEPTAGSVLILKGQGHGMPTGHVAYVEEAFPEGPTTYRLIFSHTNYDRQCHLETNIEAFYDRTALTLEVRSGAWRGWGRGLKVAGFIHGGEGVEVKSTPGETAAALTSQPAGARQEKAELSPSAPSEAGNDRGK